VDQVRILLLFEAAAFGAASLVHGGLFVTGYEHREARIAESIIAVVLFAGFIVSVVAPHWHRVAALGVQLFALLGTCVGIFTMIVGVGPQTAFDVALHAAFIALLITGITLAARRRHLPSDTHRLA
jgi:hypothetical protein